MTCDMLWGVNILSKFQLPSSYGFWFMISAGWNWPRHHSPESPGIHPEGGAESWLQPAQQLFSGGIDLVLALLPRDPCSPAWRNGSTLTPANSAPPVWIVVLWKKGGCCYVRLPLVLSFLVKGKTTGLLTQGKFPINQWVFKFLPDI